jgi:hypothetical protein
MASLTTNFWGVVLELDDAEAKAATENSTTAAGSVGPVAAAGCAATAIAAPVCAAIVAILTGYIKAQGWLIGQVNQGCGVYLTLPWAAIWTGQIYAVIPTTRPCPVALPSVDWALAGAGEFGTNDPADKIAFRVDHGLSAAEVVDFVLVIGPDSSGWDKSLFMPDGEGNEWEIKATGGRGGSAQNGLWAHQVMNGQQLRFHKPKELGLWRQVLVLGGLYNLRGGDRVTFTWLRD